MGPTMALPWVFVEVTAVMSGIPSAPERMWIFELRWSRLTELGPLEITLMRVSGSRSYGRTRWKHYENNDLGTGCGSTRNSLIPWDRLERSATTFCTAIDHCTRLRILRAFPWNDQRIAIQFIGCMLSKLPFQVEQV